jgi:hypothetical protein
MIALYIILYAIKLFKFYELKLFPCPTMYSKDVFCPVINFRKTTANLAIFTNFHF